MRLGGANGAQRLDRLVHSLGSGRIDPLVVVGQLLGNGEAHRIHDQPAVAVAGGPETRRVGGGADARDRFDRVQLAEVVRVCAGARSASEAGRHLFHASRARRSSRNDADRLRKYLQRFELDFAAIQAARSALA